MYLNSILINYFQSGFSIVEFNADISGNISDPQVIKSSGQSFDELVLNNLEQIEISNEKNNLSSSIRYRLPFYFKNKSKNLNQ